MQKIVITGPESSGKTTLTAQLAASLDLPWVEEYAREYLEENGANYVANDLVKIAQGQLKKEAKTIVFLEKNKAQHPLLLCDTSLLVLQIWSEYKYQYCADFIKNSLQKNPPDWYFLCAPDMPWEADPLRENPTNRAELFSIYEAKIKASQVPFMVLKGTQEERLYLAKKALSCIRVVYK